MKIENKFLATGLIAGFVFFGTISTAAAQTCQKRQGEISEISVRSATRHYIPGREDEIISEIEHENLIRLDERAKMICSGRAFCIDESSIKNEVEVVDDFVSIVHVQTRAIVNCLK